MEGYQDWLDKCAINPAEEAEDMRQARGEYGDPYGDEEEVEGLVIVPCPHERMKWLGLEANFRCLFCGEVIECPEFFSSINEVSKSDDQQSAE